MAAVIQQLKCLSDSNTVYPVTKTDAVYDNDNNILTDILSNKVSKESGKGLSTNDYTDADKTKVSKAITEHQSLSDYRTASDQDNIDSGKVDKTAQASKTDDMLNEVGIDESGKLWYYSFSPESETWTFTLDDGTTVEKTVYINNNVST